MLRLRCTAATAQSLRIQLVHSDCCRRAFSSTTAAHMIRRITPYGFIVPMHNGQCGTSSSTSTAPQCVGAQQLALTQCFRMFRAARGKSSAADGDDAAKQQAESDASKQQQDAAGEQQKAEGEEAQNDGKKADEKAHEPEEPKGLKGFIEGIKRDYVEFPDIYNSANAINFILFTVFCLCSTGSNVEGEWWLDQFGVDAAFRPLGWFFHSMVMNNFLSMTFAMMLLHTMCHSVLPIIGSQGLFTYCAIISIVSGVVMWAGNYAAGYTKEKQYGPWDIVAGLFVMQYLNQGFKPWQIINSFNGWVRYACWVGAACILYYDPQPTTLGAIVGFALCKTHPKFRVSVPPS